MYWETVVGRALRKTGGAFSVSRGRIIISIILFIGALLMIYALGNQRQAADQLDWGISVLIAAAVLFIPVFLFNLFAEPARMAKEKDDKIEELELRLDRLTKPKLELVYDPGRFPDCKEGSLYRIVILNPSGTTVEHVKAYLESVTPDNAIGGGRIPRHVPLMFMHDRPPWPRSLQGDTVHPGPPTTFVDIARFGVSGFLGTDNKQQFTNAVELCFVLRDLWRIMPPPLEQYRFVVLVTGRDTFLDPVAFRVNDGGIKFEA